MLGTVDADPRFCTRCGSPLDPGDRFCGRCGAAARRLQEPDDPSGPDDGDDPLAEWERHRQLRPLPAPADEAPTEEVPVARASDTAALPEVGPDTPPVPLAPPPPVAVAPRRGFPVGAVLALAGAIAVILSAVLPWTRGLHPELGPGALPRDVPLLDVVFDFGSERDGPSMGVALLWAGVAGGLTALLTMVAPVLRFLRRLIGLVTLAIPGLFVARTALGLIGQPDGLGGLGGILGAGVYVAAAGAITQMVAGRWFGR